jgi:hypothetical protein
VAISSNAQAPMQGYKDYKESRNHNITKRNNKALIMNPKEMDICEMTDK